MGYIIIILAFIIFGLSAYLLSMRYAINRTIHQMEEIEKNSESNRQLKAYTNHRILERLLEMININYRARQQERIAYLRRETQIRQEIENISHDLRTPLTAILGYVDLIKDPLTQEADSMEYLDIIQKRARVLQGFIQDFYELSRMEAEDYPFTLDTVQVQSALREAAVAYYHEFTKRNIKVTIDLEEKPSVIIADRTQFNRIINNLIQNALKYADSYFELQQCTIDNHCMICFINDSNCLKEEDLKQIFDRFFSGDVTRNNQSTGLGLTISKILTEKMKGNIEARIEEERFIIELHWETI